MPRNKKYGNVTGSDTAVIDREDNAQDEETTEVSSTDVDTEADTDTQFEFSMEPAPEDFTPDRKTPGRQRKPSFFDDKLRDPEIYGKGWQRVPFSSEEHKQAILRELHRAKMYLNSTGMNPGEDEIGLALDVKQDDAIYFKSRKAQKRERKAKNKDANPQNLDEDEGDNGDEDYYEDEDDNE